MFKWRIVFLTKTGRKFVVRGINVDNYVAIRNEVANSFTNSENGNGYLSLMTDTFRVQLRISEIDCVVYRKTFLGW